MRGPLRSSGQALLLLVCVLLGALTGTFAADRRGSLYLPPVGLDHAVWHVVTPVMSPDVKQVDSGRGSFLRGGALVFGEYSFGRADRLVPQDERAISALEIALTPTSGPLEIVFRGPDRTLVTRLAYDAMGTQGGQWTPREPGVMRYEVTPHGVMANGTNLGSSGTGSIEVTSAGDAQLAAIRAWDEGGALFLDEDYSRAGARTPVWMGPGLGGLVGLLFGLAARTRSGAVAAGLSLLPVLGVLSLSHHDQVGVVERFYLPMKAWELAPWLLLTSLLPLVGAAAMGSGQLVVGRRDRRRLYWWAPGVVALAAAALGSRALGGSALLWALGGALVLLMPTVLGFRARLPAAWVLVSDLPALVALAWFGWVALLPALLWRLIPVFASLEELVSKARGPTAEHLFLTLLLLPVGAEVSLRSGLGDAWSGLGETRLELGELDPFWSGSCGDGVTSVVFGGGSSTGGAYQFPDEPDAFYPSTAHARLCESRGITTWNYGHGGRNTHVLADGIDRVMDHTAADVVVLYVGVNDLLTQHSALTRRERDARRGGASLGRYSRLVTGLGLAFRTPEATEGDRVADVPLADAEDNLRRVAAAALQGDARVVLVAQYIAPSIEGDVAAYWAMEERLAEELDHVYFVDPRPKVARAPEPLLDTNHLSRSGNNALGEALAEALEPLL